MAATASMASLTVPGVTDDMDLQSDSGYGYEDGDIDIDLESTGENMQGEDDDLILQDAGMDTGDAVSAEHADMDEFMDDGQGSLDLGGDEDIVDVGTTFTDDVDHQDDVEQDNLRQSSPAQQSTISVAPQPGTTDKDDGADDIIDYSSDEDEPQKSTGFSTLQTVDDGQEQKPARNTRDDIDSHGIDVESEHSGHDDNHRGGHDDDRDENSFENNSGNDGVYDDVAEQTWDDSVTNDWQEQQADGETYADNGDGEVHDETGNALDHSSYEEGSRSQASSDYAQDEDHYDEERKASPRSRQDDYDDTNQQQGEVAHNEEDPDEHGDAAADEDEQSRLHSIMLNYSGTEMFLFEPHPDQQPQMFLLSDETVAGTSFHALFQACRTQLGDSIKHDTELGIRVKDLKNLEIYEDSVACASFCLKDLVDIYLALHRQDGNLNPDALYLNILFRPRVISIFGELKKAVEDHLGFSGLESTSSSAQGLFEDTGSHQGDHEHDEWDEDEHSVLALNEDVEGRHSDDDEDYVEPSKASHEASAKTTSRGESFPPNDPNAPENVEAGNQDATDRENSSAAAANAAEDFIEFAEEDEDPDEGQTVQESSNEPSSGSSTVQGDNSSFPPINEDLANPSDTFDEEQLNFEFGETYGDARDRDGNNYDQGSSLATNANFDENGSLNLAGHLEAGPVDTANSDNLLEGFDYTAGAGEDGNFDDLLGGLPSTDGANDFTGGNDDEFVDLDRGEGLTTEVAVADGDAGQDASTSQSGHLDADSPQGHKRSIDEVDGGVGSSDQSDDKRVRL